MGKEPEQTTDAFTSYSKDRRFLYIDGRTVTQQYLFDLLKDMAGVESTFVFRYSVSGIPQTITSSELSTGDPEEDFQFIFGKSEEMLCADLIEVEKVLDVPQEMVPNSELTS